MYPSLYNVILLLHALPCEVPGQPPFAVGMHPVCGVGECGVGVGVVGVRVVHVCIYNGVGIVAVDTWGDPCNHTYTPSHTIITHSYTPW